MVRTAVWNGRQVDEYGPYEEERDGESGDVDRGPASDILNDIESMPLNDIVYDKRGVSKGRKKDSVGMGPATYGES